MLQFPTPSKAQALFDKRYNSMLSMALIAAIVMVGCADEGPNDDVHQTSENVIVDCTHETDIQPKWDSFNLNDSLSVRIPSGSAEDVGKSITFRLPVPDSEIDSDKCSRSVFAQLHTNDVSQRWDDRKRSPFQYTNTPIHGASLETLDWDADYAPLVVDGYTIAVMDYSDHWEKRMWPGMEQAQTLFMSGARTTNLQASRFHVLGIYRDDKLLGLMDTSSNDIFPVEAGQSGIHLPIGTSHTLSVAIQVDMSEVLKYVQNTNGTDPWPRDWATRLKFDPSISDTMTAINTHIDVEGISTETLDNIQTDNSERQLGIDIEKALSELNRIGYGNVELAHDAGANQVFQLDAKTLNSLQFQDITRLLPASLLAPTSPKPNLSHAMPKYVRLEDETVHSPFIGTIRRQSNMNYINATAIKEDGSVAHVFFEGHASDDDCGRLCQDIIRILEKGDADD